jgi:hypothetical protein
MEENQITTTAPTVSEFRQEWGFLLEEPGAPFADEIERVDAFWCTRGDLSEIERVDAFWCTRGDLSETNLAALLALTGGSWAALVSWCDTTGYGCQDGTDWKVCATREEAISQGLDLEARRYLGLELSGEKIAAEESV